MLLGAMIGAFLALTVGTGFDPWFQAAPLVTGALCGLAVELFRRFIEGTIPHRGTGDDGMSNEPEKTDRKRRRWPSAVPYVILTPLVYMGAYYATVAHFCSAPDGKYMIGDAELLDYFQRFFAPADWAEHWLELGPCRPVEIHDPSRSERSL
jgi:hypothetical protein